MFERFRIKTALRGEIILLRQQGLDSNALAQAELLFFEPAFFVAPRMKRERWTSEQAMVHMVTEMLVQAEKQGALTALRTEDARVYEALRAIYRHVIARAAADPALAACVSKPEWAQPAPFADGGESTA
ncbi:hypothetical protein ACSBM8_16680 [Sphingomonas sp. ASY06-1R]|uniref:hypothetical protein n=1 Tax=Sphingomonas sp. ASY06-1R TaxID=3445771 RepID=UPI003FA21449